MSEGNTVEVGGAPPVVAPLATPAAAAPAPAVPSVPAPTVKPGSSATVPAGTGGTGAPTIAAAPEPEGGDKPVATPASWPEDWRQKLAGEDKAYLKTLERFSSPETLAKAYAELRKKASEGEIRRPAPKDATPEDLAVWRKEAGIPEKPEDYKIELGAGVVMGEADKPLIESFKGYAHAKNWEPAKLNEAIGWYYEHQQALRDKMAEDDLAYNTQAADALRQEWGPEYRRNINAVQNLMAGAPKGLSDRIIGGRTADGRRIGDDPDALRWFAQMAREMNPAASLVPAGTADSMGTIEDEIAANVKRMSADRKGWFADEKAQARHRELLTAREKMQKRA